MWMVPVASLTNFSTGVASAPGFGDKRRIVTHAPRKSGGDGQRLPIGVVDRDAGNLLAVLEAIHQALQLAIGVARHQRLGGTDQALRQHLGVILQILPQPQRVRARLEKRERQRDYRYCGDQR